MRYALSLAALLLAAATFCSAAPQAPAVKACQCATGGVCTCGDVCGCGTRVASASDDVHYGNAYERALGAGKPLLVFVGQRPFEYPGALTCRVESFPGFQGLAGIVVAKPSDDGKSLWRVADLGPSATGADVKRALSRCPECELASAAAACATCVSVACGPCAGGSCAGGSCAPAYFGGCSSGACGSACSGGSCGQGGCSSGSCGGGRGRRR